VALTFCRKKLLFVSSILLLCGLLVVFFRGLSLDANKWMVMSFTFLPIFLCAGVLLSTGIMLIRIYHDEVKGKNVFYRQILSKSWELIIGASYFSIPIILCYLLLWMLLGIFLLLQEIPGLGEFFGVVLSFGPFLINLGSLILCVLSVSMLFFLAPILALRGFNRTIVSHVLVKRIQKDFFSNILLAIIATFPLLFFAGLFSLSAFLTDSICLTCHTPLHTVLQWFFIMIPFSAFLSPSVIFFFNFAAESHVLLIKKQMIEGS
jgi:hypothetical protein